LKNVKLILNEQCSFICFTHDFFTFALYSQKVAKIAVFPQWVLEKCCQKDLHSLFFCYNNPVSYLITFHSMKKQDLIKAMATKAGLSQDAAGKALNALIDVVTASLKKGVEVNVTGFGAFKVSSRAARNGVNPRTRAKIKIPAMKSPVFRAGKTLKEAVR
jgi:DNA-binding protein HU-beta